MGFRIGIVVGELSGDALAANLIRTLKKHIPEVSFEGVLGPQLLSEGGHSFFAMDRLSVMGFFAPLKRLPELIRMRRFLINHFIQNPPNLFIGVDAPDFNLGIEKKLKAAGIPTVHYVSPSVWAWRQGRIKTIQQSVNLMLTLLPFEAKFYEDHHVPVAFVGHPLADQIPLVTDTKKARAELGISYVDLKNSQTKVITLMPGSRENEIKYLAEVILKTARLCYEKNPHILCLVPLVSENHRSELRQLQQEIAPHVPIQFLLSQSHLAIAASDVVLVTSGTATLEVMLHKKPMVVVYRMHPLTYQIAKRLVKTPYIALPNLLANELLVPEFIQDKANPEELCKAIMATFGPFFETEKLVARFTALHQLLQQDSGEKCFKAIMQHIPALASFTLKV